MSDESTGHRQSAFAAVPFVSVSGDLSIHFPGPDGTVRTKAITFDEDHVLNLELDGKLRLRTITVLDPTRRLGAPAALGGPDAWCLVQDTETDCLCIEFREGIACRSEPSEGDAVEINGEEVLWLQYGAGEELEGIWIWHVSRRVPGF